MGKLEGKVAIVTGASRGIGKGTPGLTVPRQIETMGGTGPVNFYLKTVKFRKKMF